MAGIVAEPEGTSPNGVVRFSVFELDLRSGELRRNGLKIKLQDQPFRVLRILLERPGDIVTREELQRQIWPSDTFVDFDRGLNNAVKRVREALGDTAESPRYIETLPKRGYRFIGTLRGPEPANHAPTVQRIDQQSRSALRRPIVLVGMLAVVTCIALAVAGSRILDRFRAVRSPSTAEPAIHSLAVIPLSNLSADSEQEYFSDGITDALITELAQLRAIRVISRTSMMRYKKSVKSLPEIARELNVDGILEGTVQRSGERVRITVQLIHAPSDRHLWASTYERDLSNIFALERDLTAEIATKVQAEIASDGQAPPSRQPVKVEALEAYLKGKRYLERVGEGYSDTERRNAATYFQHAINLAPDFAEAYRGLADAHCYCCLPTTDEDRAIIRNANHRLGELDPEMRGSPGHACPAGSEKEQKGDLAGAEQEYRTCVALKPNEVSRHRSLANFLDGVGRLDEGWTEHLIAQQLDPFPMGPELDLPAALVTRHQYERAIEMLKQVLDSQPNDGQTHLMLSDIYREKGLPKEEIEELGRFATSYGHPETEPRLREAFVTSGYTGALRRWAQDFEQVEETGNLYAPAYLASVYLRLNDHQHAYRWLEEAYTGRTSRRSPCSLDYDSASMLEDLRKEQEFNSDPRFLELLRRINFSQ